MVILRLQRLFYYMDYHNKALNHMCFNSHRFLPIFDRKKKLKINL